MRDFEIRPLVDADIPDVLSALGDAFSREFTDDWFRWKHRDNPSGESYGLVAEDKDGFLGVRLFLRWRFDWMGGQLHCLRPCDTVTVPRSRRRGVFKALTERAMSEVAGDADFLFNTPNEQSLPGYLKLGFEQWTTVAQGVRIVPPGRSPMIEALGASPESNPEICVTTRDQPFLEWRYGSRSGFEYTSVTLAQASAPCGLVYRTRPWRGQRLVVVSEIWGTPTEARTLERAVAREAGAIQWHRSRRKWGTAHSTLVTRKALRLHTMPARPVLSVGDIEDVL